MWTKLVLILTLFGTILCKYEPETIDVEYGKPYSYSVNQTHGYILEFSGEKKNAPYRVTISTNNGDNDTYPLMIVARTFTEQLSWTLPLRVETSTSTRYFPLTSRIICKNPHPVLLKSGEQENENPIVSVSTSSQVPVDFTVEVDYVEDFYIKPSVQYNTTVSPSEPRYFYYNFSSNASLNDLDSNYETVILEVNSEDNICMTVSIQNAKCPVLDLNEDITYRGFYMTVSKKGGITIPKNKFKDGFFVVFVAKGDDKDCTNEAILDWRGSRNKTVWFTVEPSITYTDYQNAVLITLGAIIGFYFVFLCGYIICWKKTHVPRLMQYVTPSSSTVNTPTVSGIVEEQARVPQVDVDLANPMADTVSLDEAEYDNLIDADSREVRLCKRILCLDDLARKDPRIHKQKSYLYLYNVLTMALFYGLPAIQLVIIYQKVLNRTGEQDLCYYNFLCAHPLGSISDFNHVFSNVGYVLLGVLFLGIVYNRERTHKDLDFERSYGIPQHYGMFYAMGVALIMEGVLSGSYHVCPNKSNFQFDSSFMYVMTVLCMVKLYQNRHPDINANAYSTFGVLAVAILLGMIGILENNTFFFIFFTILHILICLYLTAQIYYMGCWKCDRGVFVRIYRTVVNDFRSGPLNVLKPAYTGRFFLLLAGNICNWLLAYFALANGKRSFPLYLLGVFMANTLLYFFFYIIMKYINKERVNLRSWVFLILSWLCAASAMYFFLHKGISWSTTPAESRLYNKDCTLFRFYDYHDIWHFLSAIGMFFTFMVLLTMDDDLSHVHRSAIAVF
ncbi:SID1 transmembrane family member 1 [Aethina tumida]|uniref:SID1 transmembrane family member 1 n=1 Tax=Aethina tumida TaxID=116153 RepID=UPI00214947EC|nr:SID1 transmembrane family member 1 [Aethina tumida]